VPLIIISAALVLPALSDQERGGAVDAFGALRLLFSRKTAVLADARHTAFAAFAFLHAAFFGADAYVVLTLTAVRGISLELASLCVTFGALGWSGASAIQPLLLSRIGARRVCVIGVIFGTAAAAGMLVVTTGAPVYLAFIAWFFGGAGVGFC